MKKQLACILGIVVLVLWACEMEPEEELYSATRDWFNTFINATDLNKDTMLSDVSTTPRTWCGKVYDVKRVNANEYEITLDFGSSGVGAPKITMTTYNQNTANSASDKKGKLFSAKNRGRVTYSHYIYHTIYFKID